MEPEQRFDGGMGIFFRFGASDGQIKSIKKTRDVALTGNRVLLARPDATFGVGWSRIQFGDNRLPFLRDARGLGLGREDAAALYSNVAAAKWLGLMVDLQIVDLWLKKTLPSSGGLDEVDIAIVGGLRSFVRC